MISRVLEQEKALRQVLSVDRKTAHLVLTWQDLEVLESINKVLAPLADFTDILSGEKYVTFSALVPLLKHITDDILCEDEEDTTLTADIKQQIITYLQNKYEDAELKQLLYIASFLDPRFKTEYIPNDNVTAIKGRISLEGLQNATDNNSTTATSTTESAETSPPPAKKKTLGSILKKSREAQQPKTPEEKLKAEMDSYLSAAVLDSESNPLDWWSVEHRNYPILAQLAKKYLCICASSVASEKLFSTSGNVVTPKRSCLKPEKVNMLVFLAKNL